MHRAFSLTIWLSAVQMIAAMILATPNVVWAQNIYYYQDSQGNLSFSDEVEHNGYKNYRQQPAATVRSQSHIELYIEHYAKLNSLEVSLVRALIKAESNFNPNALSPKGAQGIMQIMPKTASMLQLRNPYDCEANIKAGTSYLAQLLRDFSGNLELAIAAYNAGPNAVKKYNSIPPYPETTNYVRQVMHYYRQYRTLS